MINIQKQRETYLAKWVMKNSIEFCNIHIWCKYRKAAAVVLEIPDQKIHKSRGAQKYEQTKKKYDQIYTNQMKDMIRLNNLFFFVSKKRKQTMNGIGEEAEFEKRETAFVFKQKKDGNDNDGGGKGKKRSKSFIWFVIHTSHHITSLQIVAACRRHRILSSTFVCHLFVFVSNEHWLIQWTTKWSSNRVFYVKCSSHSHVYAFAFAFTLGQTFRLYSAFIINRTHVKSKN